MSRVEVAFHGVRGSMPYTGPGTTRFGRNSLCVSVSTPEKLLIFDAGYGIVGFGAELPDGGEYDLFFTHLHQDHIEGLPYFKPIYDRDALVRIHAGVKHPLYDALLSRTVSKHIPRPRLARFGESTVRQGNLMEFSDCSVEPFRLNHPGGAMGYLIDTKDGKIGLVWDHEHGVDEDIDRDLEQMIRGVDILVFDGGYCNQDQYDNPSVYGPATRGWGHTSAKLAAQVAHRCEVGELHLIHYNPLHDDHEIIEVIQEAQMHFPTAGAREGQVIRL